MALQGTFQQYSLGQLLNLVHIARKSGGLAVQSSEGAADLYFDGGKLVAAQIGQPQTLADLMVQSGKLDQAQAAAATAHGSGSDDRQLGLLLLNMGQVSRDDIVQALRQHMLNVLYTVWTWNDGAFVWDQTRTPPSGRVTIPIGLEQILVEGNRQATNAIQPATTESDTPLSLEVALRFTDGFGEKLRSVNLSPREWRIVSAINPRTSVAEIAAHSKLSEAEIRESVARLQNEGLVEVAGAPEVALAAPIASTPTSTKVSEGSVQQEPPMATESGPTPGSSSAPAPARGIKQIFSRFRGS